MFLFSIAIAGCSSNVIIVEDSPSAPLVDKEYSEYGVLGLQSTTAQGYHFVGTPGSDLTTNTESNGYKFEPIWMPQ